MLTGEPCAGIGGKAGDRLPQAARRVSEANQIRTHGSEGGAAQTNVPFLPLSDSMWPGNYRVNWFLVYTWRGTLLCAFMV